MKTMKGHEGFLLFFFMNFMSFMVKFSCPERKKRTEKIL